MAEDRSYMGVGQDDPVVCTKGDGSPFNQMQDDAAGLPGRECNKQGALRYYRVYKFNSTCSGISALPRSNGNFLKNWARRFIECKLPSF